MATHKTTPIQITLETTIPENKTNIRCTLLGIPTGNTSHLDSQPWQQNSMTTLPSQA